MANKREYRVTLRVSQEEHEKIFKRAADLNITTSQFLRLIFDIPAELTKEQIEINKKNSESLNSFISQVSGIASNLNQITRYANAQLNNPDLKFDNASLEKAIKDTSDVLNLLYKKLED